MYVIKKTEQRLWTVGYYLPNGDFYPESDHDSEQEAREYCSYYNGGPKPTKENR